LGRKIENDLYCFWFAADTGPVRVRADPFTDRRHIAQMPDIPLRRFGVLISRHAPDMESGHTFLGVFLADLVRAWLQNFRAHKLKAIRCKYLRL
jgi:hypothetical protein